MEKNKQLIFDDVLKEELSKEKQETLNKWIEETKEERQFKDIVIIQTPFHSNDNFINRF